MADEVDHRRRGARYRARRRAVSLLFEAELRDADVVQLAEERRRMGEESQEFHDVAPYTMEIVTGVAERLDRLDAEEPASQAFTDALRQLIRRWPPSMTTRGRLTWKS